MKLSVIIPVYNSGKSAERLIVSLLAQYTDMEIIAVDDKSGDDSLSRLRGLARKDKRVKVVALKQNAGASAARNAGINISQGEYLCFIDSDDEVTDDYVSEMLGAIDGKRKVGLAACGIRFNKIFSGEQVDAYIRPWRGRRNREKLSDYVIESMVRDGRMYSSVNKIYHGKIVREKGVRFEEGRDFAEDTKFVLDYLHYSSGDIIFIPRALYIYNFGTENSTVKRSSAIWSNWERQFQDMVGFAKQNGGIGAKTLFLLALLAARWRISWLKAKKRARA